MPDAAWSASHELDTEDLTVRLRHLHLPKLAEAGYIRWESDPFTVSRGPHFAEPALVLDRMTESETRLPRRLRDECAVIGEVTENASD
ncbi:hypothetical protein [Haloarchaeobius litoreus]|uniref:Uncharacterized protein n=1 Tax=Haloarchaeobius litoreus TaxID=755306 RepID=A0ABD6DMT2_9EURY|nr:hypothetical protein [Haloarchaeobius litoreus]